MKKIICSILGMLLLFGCCKSNGSFEDGNKDMNVLYEKISTYSNEGKFKMALQEESWWKQSQIEEKYQLDLSNVEESYVKSSPIEAEFGEIAFFKVSKDNEKAVKKAIEYRLKSLKNKWGHVILDANKQLQHVKTGRIGQYYYMILGEDCKKVVNYIQDMK